MTSKILNPREHNALQPAYALWNQYRPENAPYRFTAQDLDQAAAWQTRTRQALKRVIGFQDLPPVDPQPELLEVVDRGDYLREKVLLRTSPDTLMPVYLLIPKKAARPGPAVVAFAGHGYGVISPRRSRERNAGWDALTRRL